MGDWMIGALVLVSMASVFLWSTIRRRKQTQILEKVWTELAEQVGLHYSQGGWPDAGISRTQSVSGVYRGRYLCLEEVREWIGAGEDARVFDFIHLSVRVDIPADFQLNVHPKSFIEKLLEPIFHGKEISDRDEMSREFHFNGQPNELVYGSIGILRRYKTILMSARKKSIITGIPQWTPPSFEIKGKELVCRQRWIITDIYQQILLFNLMLELSDYAEKLGNRLQY